MKFSVATVERVKIKALAAGSLLDRVAGKRSHARVATGHRFVFAPWTEKGSAGSLANPTNNGH